MKTLKLQFNEDLSNWMKVAILTDMLPGSIQDFIYTHVDKGTTYEALRERIRALISNKVAQVRGPVQMDIGNVKDEEDWDGWGRKKT